MKHMALYILLCFWFSVLLAMEVQDNHAARCALLNGFMHGYAVCENEHTIKVADLHIDALGHLIPFDTAANWLQTAVEDVYAKRAKRKKIVKSSDARKREYQKIQNELLTFMLCDDIRTAREYSKDIREYMYEMRMSRLNAFLLKKPHALQFFSVSPVFLARQTCCMIQ